MQNETGENRSEFVDSFLKRLPDHVAESIETKAHELFGIRAFNRFRTRLVFTLAGAYQNGIIAERNGQSVDALALIEEIKERRRKQIKSVNELS